jgi:pimeloyl-ACP methyl ester carboxylesterase
MSPAPREVAMYLHHGEDPVFAIFHEPAREFAGSTAVLMCPPFGWDDTCSYRSRRDWAQHLAGEGIACLRMDLPGTGDSGGSPHDPQRVASWVDAVTAAAAELRKMSGCVRVVAIGIGLGGLLVCRALAAGAQIEEVVLWAVPARGRTLLRELRTFASLEGAELVSLTDEALQPAVTAQGDVWVGGFVLTAETAGALEELDVSRLAFAGGFPRRALLLGRDGIDADKRLHKHLAEAGVEVTVSRGDGYGEMMAPPHDARSPTEVFTKVSAWLGQGTPAPPAPAPSGAVSLEHASSTIELSVAGAPIRETPVSIAQPFGELFGILAEPLRGSSGDVCAVLLNAGAIRRVGPNRMWVETARRWAALGVPTLRLDVEGIGDADGDTDRFDEMAQLYVPALVDQVRGALDDLTERGLGPRFVLAGLCSGAYWAFHAALCDERVVGAYLLNPRTLFWDPTLAVAREVRKAFSRASAWQRLLRGEIPLRRMTRLASRAPAVLARRAVAQVARRAARRRGGDELDRALDQLRDADKRVRLMFSANEPLLEELQEEGRLDRLDRWPNLAVETISGNVHTLRPAGSQQSAHAALDRALDDELQRAFKDALSAAS